MSAVDVGTHAPDFTLVDQDRQPVTLSASRGKPVVLAFFPGAFSSTCTAELCTFNNRMFQLNAAHAQVYGISVDTFFTLKAFRDSQHLTFPLLSDWGGEATHKYGVYVDEYKAARRINFLIGKDGKILEEQVDKDAIDPKKIVDACERPKLKS